MCDWSPAGEGGGWRSRIPQPRGPRTPSNRRVRRQLTFDQMTPNQQGYCPEGSSATWAPKAMRDPRRGLHTPEPGLPTYDERAEMLAAGQHMMAPYTYLPYQTVNYGNIRKGLFRSPALQDLTAETTYGSACDSPLSVMYSTPPPSSHPFRPPPPPMPSPSRMPPPFDPAEHLRPCKMRSTALPGVVKPIMSPFSYRDPSDFVTMHDLINQDYLRLGPFPPAPPQARSTPKPVRSTYSKYYDMRGMRGRYFPTPEMFAAMPGGEWGADEDEYWPDREEFPHLYDPRTAVCPDAPSKIRISPWPKHHPAPPLY